MVSISYMGRNEKIIRDIREKEEELGTQNALHDYTTGIFTRIIPMDRRTKTYTLCESSFGWTGFINEMFGTYEAMGLEDGYELEEAITNSINDGDVLTEDEVNKMINEGFLNLISTKNPQIKEIEGFQTLLTAERFLKEFERNGSIIYSEVIREINAMLGMENISEEERKALETLKAVYEDDIFKQYREEYSLLQEAQENANKNRTTSENVEHSAKEISEDLQEIARTGIKDSSLHDIISSNAVQDKSKAEEK